MKAHGRERIMNGRFHNTIIRSRLPGYCCYVRQTICLTGDRKTVSSKSRQVMLWTYPYRRPYCLLLDDISFDPCLKAVDIDESALCKEECTPKSQYPWDDTVFDLCCLLMQEKGWDAPKDAFSAAELYILLRTEILQNI